MCLYAVSLQPSIAPLNASTFVKQCCFADDTTGAGSSGETEEMVWCTKRNRTELRIFSQCEKVLAYCEARERRGSEESFWSNINKHLHSESKAFRSSMLGSRSYLMEYVSEKVDDWVGQVVNRNWQSLQQTNHKPAMRHIPSV